MPCSWLVGSAVLFSGLIVCRFGVAAAFRLGPVVSVRGG